MPKKKKPATAEEEAYEAALGTIEEEKKSKEHVLLLNSPALNRIPPEIGKLKGLQRLYIQRCHVATLPPEIGKLKRLRVCQIYKCELVTVPPAIGQLTGLELLDLDSNRLATLPTEIGQLTNLTTLDVRNNHLTALPKEIGQLTHLKRLIVYGNPLPPEILELAERNKLIPYLRDLAAAEKHEGEVDRPRPFNEAKLLLVGPGEVGKTWLLHALQGKTPKPMGSTKGLEIAREPLDLPHPTDQARNIHFNCWDFGGQDQYQITHQVFYSPKAVYLLEWKPRAGVDPDLISRLERIQLSAGRTAKVFIVSTHADGNVPAVIGKEAIKERFGDLIWGFFSIDSEKGPKGTGIAALKLEIAEAAAQLEGMDLPFPAKWHDAQKDVRKITEPTLTFAAFGEICSKQDVEPDSIAALASIMDVQGHVRYFADAVGSAQAGVREGENLVVLDPEWLAKAVAFVLEDDQTGENSGVLQHDHLKQVWRKNKKSGCPGYPAGLHGYLLWLMWKFDIAYRQDGQCSLVPELIHRNRPDDLRWTPATPSQGRQATLICRIKQDPPPGLVPVLTAATHPLRRIMVTQVFEDRLDRNWRDGFFLDTARRGEAFVELDDRDLHITVRDRYPSDLIRQIRKTLGRIIQDRWPRLPHDFAVPCIGSIDDKPCSEAFKIEYLEKRTGKKVSCQECGSDNLEVDKMLEGFDANAEELLRRLQQLKAGQTDLMTVAMRFFHDALDPARIELERAPCMFTILPWNVKGWDLLAKLTEVHIGVTCWCEHPDGPHLGAPIGSKEPPDYVLKTPKEWLVKAAPYISWAATLLKAFTPLAGTVVKQGLGDSLTQDLKNKIDLMGDVAKALPSGKLEVGRLDELEAKHGARPEIVALRHIHDALLKQVPEANRWGDLRPVPTKSGDLLWLCQEHAVIQQPAVPTSS